LLRIRLLADNLASIGDHLPLSQHIDIILEGLPSDFNSVISVVESKFETMEMDEVEALLLAHETRLEKAKKKTLSDTASINLAQNPNADYSQNEQTDEPQPSANNTYGSDPAKASQDNSRFAPYNPNNRGRGGRNGKGRGRSAGGRGNNNGNLQCQICFKANHSALDSWHRLNQLFQPQIPPQFQGFPLAPPPGYFQEAYGPYSGQNFPPRYGQSFGYGPQYNNNWPSTNPPPKFPAQQSHPSAMLANAPSTSTTPAWYPDSGASYHVTNDARNI
jgi:hypothetical protein